MSNPDKSYKKKSAQSANNAIKEGDLWDLDEDYNSSTTTALALDKAITKSTSDRAEKAAYSEHESTPVKKSTRSTEDAPLVKKPSLSIIEKLALFGFAAMLLSGGALGYIWLYKKNELCKVCYTIDLPANGTYATLTGFSTCWKSADDFSGVKKGTAVVPVVHLTLGKKSTSGVLRCYFYNHQKDIVGDPVTMNFKDGLFDNGKNTLEVSATDGLKTKNELLAYQMEPSLNWQIIIQEAENQNVKGSDFKPLVNTTVSLESKASGE